MKLKLCFLFFIVVVLLNACSSEVEWKKAGEHDDVRINKEAFKTYLYNKPYTVLYFWAEWCPISRKSLIEDYNKHYAMVNNDSIQSLLIVASDSASVERFMKENNLNLPYKCLSLGVRIPPYRNIQDSNGLKLFMKEIFNYDTDDLGGFPDVFFVKSQKDSLEVWRLPEVKDVPKYCQ